MKLFNHGQQAATASVQKIVFPARRLQTSSVVPDSPDSVRFGKKPKNLLQEALLDNRRQVDVLKQQIATSKTPEERKSLQGELIKKLEKRLDLKSSEHRIEERLSSFTFYPLNLAILPIAASPLFVKPETRKALRTGGTFASRMLAAMSFLMIGITHARSKKKAEKAMVNKLYLKLKPAVTNEQVGRA